MKNITLLSFFLLTFFISHAQFQQFGSTKMLGYKNRAIGFNPFIMIPEGDNPEGHKYSAISLSGTYAFSDQVDFTINGGLLADKIDNQPEDYSQNSYYLGIELEGQVLNTGKRYKPGFEINIAGGVHAWHDNAGFDGTLKIGYRASRKFHIYTGADADMNLYTDNQGVNPTIATRMLARVPIGIEIIPSNTMSIILEADMPLTEYDLVTIGGGMRFYFEKR